MNGRYLWLLISIFFCLPNSLYAQGPIPDFTRGGKVPEKANHDWNLGPTGARGWIYSNRLETTQARQILVTKVEKYSPADGLLRVKDVVLGVDEKKFSGDPRVSFGRAIGEAEAKDGQLSLLVWRDGKTVNIKVPVGVLGRYSPTAPFDCSKSIKILRRGCDRLAEEMERNQKGGNRIVRSYNTLALLASGDEKYLPIIKREVRKASKYSDVKGRSLCCWFYGPTCILLAEYTIATGDKTFLPDLKRIAMEIVDGQSAVGSWGHRFARKDGRLNGYGMMNAPGLPMTLGLVLAREAGVKSDRLDKAIDKSVRLIRFYVGKGSVPYGDHHPWIETHDDNGKNGVAAVLFNLLGDRQAAEYFSRMSVASHGKEREMGHTGNFFNILWAMPSVALSGPEATGAWMKEYAWYYDLARRHDGSFLHQGPPQLKNDSYRNWDATGLFLLAYAQPLRKLYITGKRTGFLDPVDRSVAKELVDAGRGYSHRLKNRIYEEKTDQELLQALGSWSPVVRQRAANAIGRRKNQFDIGSIDKLLKSENLFQKLGACQAMAAVGPKGADSLDQLKKLLSSEDLWLRIKAAEAIAAMKKKARPYLPELLTMLSKADLKNDPRGMQQRYLCFALFDRRNGLIGKSLEGVDRDRLYHAVSAGLSNEDGRARGTLATVFKNLSFQEMEPLLPVVLKAVEKSAPSGMMFADGIRLSGLEILAKHRIKEGLPLCLELIEPDRWGQGRRIPRCLKILERYGAGAKKYVGQLEAMKKQVKNPKHRVFFDNAISTIKEKSEEVPLRSITDIGFDRN